MPFIKTHKTALALGLLLLALVILAMLYPKEHAVEPHSLAELGLTLTVPQEPYYYEDYLKTGYHPLNHFVTYFPKHADNPSCGIMGAYLGWGPGDSQELPAPMDVVEILIPQPMESASCPVVMLQGYYKAQLNRPGARIELKGQLYRPSKLRKYILWENEDLVLYNIQPLLYPTAEEMIEDFHSKQLQGPQDPNFNMDYDHGYLLRAAEFTRNRAKRWISAAPRPMDEAALTEEQQQWVNLAKGLSIVDSRISPEPTEREKAQFFLYIISTPRYEEKAAQWKKGDEYVIPLKDMEEIIFSHLNTQSFDPTLGYLNLGVARYNGEKEEYHTNMISGYGGAAALGLLEYTETPPASGESPDGATAVDVVLGYYDMDRFFSQPPTYVLRERYSVSLLTWENGDFKVLSAGPCTP